MKQKLFTCFLGILLTVNAYSYTESCYGGCGQGLEYHIYDIGTCELQIEGVGLMFDYTPAQMPTYRNCGCDITSVWVHDGITGIGNYAFAELQNCNGIILPSTVTSIGKGAFMNSSSFNFISGFPNISYVGDSAFYGCSNFVGGVADYILDTVKVATFYGTQVYMETMPSQVKYISEYAFAKTAMGPLLVIPSHVTYIGDSAFHDCKNLKYVNIDANALLDDVYARSYYTIKRFSKIFGNQIKEYFIGEHVTKIGRQAFCQEKQVEKIHIGSHVESIGNSAFYGCSNLDSIFIPNSVTSIGSEVFDGCSSLTSINVEEGNTAYSSLDGVLYNADKTVLIKCPEGKEGVIVIPNSVTSIGEYAFNKCTGLTSVVIPNSVTSIGEYAFNKCTGLTSVVIPNSVTSIGSDAFLDCSNLTSVIIPNSVTSIGSSAFYRCTGLTSIEIPNSITSIGKYTFYGCTGLTSVVIPNSVTSIGFSAFYGCSGLTSVIIPSSVTIIDSSAFSGCTSLTYVEIPNSVTIIGPSSFSGCTSLTSVEIPNSVTSIGSKAFQGCSSLTSIRIPSSLSSIGEGAFMACDSLRSVFLPHSLELIGYRVFAYDTLDTVMCEAMVPPTLKSGMPQVFTSYAGTLFVPGNSIEAYRSATHWGNFSSILPIPADTTTVTDFSVLQSDNNLVLSWPAIENADTYTLEVKDSEGNVVCTLVFNAQGELQSLNFAVPARNGNKKTQTATQTAAGWQYTLYSLDSDEHYTFTIVVTDSEDNELYSKVITNGSGLDSIDNTSMLENKTSKFLRDGQILILRGDKTYTLTGQEVK